VSFFDESDEPLTETRAAPRRRRPARGGGGGRRPPGGPGRSPSQQQAFVVRRGVALAVVVVAVVLIVLGVHSCQVSARNSALKDYSNNVASLITKSNQTGKTFFTELGGAHTSSNAVQLQTQIDQTLGDAESQLKQGKGLSVPDQMRVAQQNVVLALQMRRDGIQNIADEIQPALTKATSGDAVTRIAAEMARLYASDVVYTDYAAPAITGALHSAGIGVQTASDPNGQPIASGQFLQNISWLTPSYVASQFNASLPASASGPVAPGVHGDAMQSVSVGGQTLTPGGSATLAASPPPTFSCTFTNDGQNPETNTTVEVSVKGTSISGQAVQASTQPGGSYTVQVPLSSSPPAGTYTVTAMVERVPGETTLTHNTQTFSITFH
jgi:hypothetical protein